MDVTKIASLIAAVRDANAEARAARQAAREANDRAREAGDRSMAADRELGDYLTSLIGDDPDAHPA